MSKNNKGLAGLSTLGSMGSSSSSNSGNNSSHFDKYCSRLGYPSTMARDARSQLGNEASTSDLLSVVLSNARANGVQPNRLAQPSYLQKQDCYQGSYGEKKVPIWIHKEQKKDKK